MIGGLKRIEFTTGLFIGFVKEVVMKLTKELVYETLYELVSDSTDWGIDAESSKYGHYIDGATCLATMLLDKIKGEES